MPDEGDIAQHTATHIPGPGGGPAIPPPPPPNVGTGAVLAPPPAAPLPLPPQGMPGLPPPPPVPTQQQVPISHPAVASENGPTYDTGTQTPAEEQPVRRRRRRQQAEPEPHPNGQTQPVNARPPFPEEQVEYIGEKPKFWASIGATINIGNYESFKFDMGMSGIPYDASSEEIEEIFARADGPIHETVEVLMTKVIDRAREIKIARGIPVGNQDE